MDIETRYKRVRRELGSNGMSRASHELRQLWENANNPDWSAEHTRRLGEEIERWERRFGLLRTTQRELADTVLRLETRIECERRQERFAAQRRVDAAYREMERLRRAYDQDEATREDIQLAALAWRRESDNAARV